MYIDILIIKNKENNAGHFLLSFSMFLSFANNERNIIIAVTVSVDQALVSWHAMLLVCTANYSVLLFWWDFNVKSTCARCKF